MTQELPQREPLVIDYDPERDRVTINGITYSGEFFRVFAEPEGQVYYRIGREGDTVTITKVPLGAVNG